MVLYTIGHSNHSFAKFVELLQQNGIMTLVDVRSMPASRYNPHFNRNALEHELGLLSIEYAFAGQYLGGRPADPSCYKSGRIPVEGADYLHEVNYPEVMKRDWFRKGIERLIELADQGATAVMCSEENPAECHRHHLIAKHLMQSQPEVIVKHVRGDGAVINAATLRASVSIPDVEQPSLFE